MKKDKMVMIRMSQNEFDRLKAFADSKDISIAQVIREYVKKLPKVRDEHP